ncbi:MAG: HlyD family efflux transporter periplasmic adaptor subunit, partial [Planctomycetia bacterium]
GVVESEVLLPSKRDKVRVLEDEAESAARDLQRVRELGDNSLVSKKDVEDAELRARASSAAAAAERRSLEQLEGDLKRGKTDAQLAVEEAEAAAAKADALTPNKSLRKRRDQLQLSLRKARVPSPIAGRVLDVVYRPGETVVRGPVVRVGDTSRMVVAAEVYETDVASVSVGQTVRVDGPVLRSVGATAEGQPLTGRVEKVGLLIARNELVGVDPTARTDGRVVEVRVALDDASKVGDLSNLEVTVEFGPTAALAADGAASSRTPRR